MKKGQLFKIINIDAENTAQSILRTMPNNKPSLKALIVWVKENFECNVIIKIKDLSSTKCAGATIYDPVTNTHTIYIEKKNTFPRQRFTLGHEIGHIIRNNQYKFGFLEKTDLKATNFNERFCNRFSAAFLLPANQVSGLWNSIIDSELNKKIYIAYKYNVSLQVVNIRLKELELI